MKFTKIIIIAVLCAVCGAGGFILGGRQASKEFLGQTEKWIEQSKADDAFISALPIYEDFAASHNENVLRKHLFKDHYAAVLKTGRKPVENSADVKRFVEAGLLVPVEATDDAMFFFYGVKKENRYLAPPALSALEKITAAFNKKLDEQNLPTVKIALSSALRPVEYQQSLRKQNANATQISTHSYGMSFDIFYDDYYVKLDSTAKPALGKADELMRRRLGFMLGDSLRRQLKTALFQTLEELQEQGEIFAIAEKNQRCYHVTPAK